MPELPDLEIYSENLNKRLAGKTVVAANVFRFNRINAHLAQIEEAVVGHQLDKITRAGKELYLTFSSGTVLAVHLMLNGHLDITPGERPISNRDMILLFDDGSCLTMSDRQALLKITLNPADPTAPDAMSLEFSVAYLQTRLQKNGRMNIKQFLINQRIVRGIGNAYVDEILWEALISPKSVCGKIPPERVQPLYDAVHKVFDNAVAQIRQHQPAIISGEYRDFLNVHHYQKKMSPTGKPIICERVVSKKTFYTEEQILYR
ncbi:formamidopyrimidine-DNA glycosylase, partial [bacterium]|nr:formamidopyrimidine-DNA glycosylase [bacterium]